MLSQPFINISDLVGEEYMRTIQYTIGHIACVPIALLDTNRNPLPNEENLYVFQFSIQRDPSLAPAAHGALCQDPSDLSKPSILTNPTSGLKSALIPIVINGKHVSNWFISQIRMRPFDILSDQSIVELPLVSADNIGANDGRSAHVTDYEFEHILHFLLTTTSTITDLGATNVALNQRNKELLASTEKLDKSLNAFKQFINLADIGTYLVDYETGKLLMYSNTYQDGFNLSSDHCLDHTCFYHMGYDDFCPFCPKVELLDETGEPTGPYVWENFNPKFNSWLSITSRALRWIDGRMVMMTSFIDITKRKQEEQRIAYLAYHDQNLNIPNAVKLSVDLNKCYGEQTYLLFSDIKSLRDINSLYGRSAGDGLLSAIAVWLCDFTGETNCVYRIDGDNFAVLYQNTSAQEVKAFADEISLRFESPWFVDLDGVVQRIYASVHLGITQAKKPIESYSSLPNLAEKVLSFAKNAYRAIIFDEEMDQQYQAHLELSTTLKACVFNHMQGFSISYQPVVDVQTGRWTGLEALCRWTCPDGTAVPPSIFIGEAEKIGIVAIIDSWVLQQSICQIKALGLDQLPNFILSVNLSPVQLRDKELATFVLNSLKQYDYPVDKFSLEITETVEIQFDDLTYSVLYKLRESGIKLSLDDFGTGFATFSNLKNLPISILKTDRSFITGIEENQYLQETMRIMMQFSHLAGLDVTVEGVETTAQYEIIKKNGANHIQGFYFSKPLPLDVLIKNLDHFK